MSALASAMESNGFAWSHACVGACAEVKVGDFGLGLALARADGEQPEPWCSGRGWKSVRSGV